MQKVVAAAERAAFSFGAASSLARASQALTAAGMIAPESKKASVVKGTACFQLKIVIEDRAVVDFGAAAQRTLTLAVADALSLEPMQATPAPPLYL